jgi:hypothetical protein
MATLTPSIRAAEMFGFGKKATTGVERAAMRPKRTLPEEALLPVFSRQQRLENERAEKKRELTVAKKDAMKLKWPGGSAAVR